VTERMREKWLVMNAIIKKLGRCENVKENFAPLSPQVISLNYHTLILLFLRVLNLVLKYNIFLYSTIINLFFKF
jgi:hypothetical protein